VETNVIITPLVVHVYQVLGVLGVKVLVEMMDPMLVVIVPRRLIVRTLPDVVSGNLVLLIRIKQQQLAQIPFQTAVRDIPIA